MDDKNSFEKIGKEKKQSYVFGRDLGNGFREQEMVADSYHCSSLDYEFIADSW